MEEQPKDRAQDRRYYHHGEDRNLTQHAACLKNDQTQFQQHQHQETQTKKTGSRKINIGEDDGVKALHTEDTVGMPYSTNSNGSRHVNANVKQKSAQKVYPTVSKVGSKVSDHKKNMDLKNDKEKALDLNHHEGQPSDKKEPVLLQNGVVNCDLITNGFSTKQPLDNDGSGSEGGYTTPKKRKARCNSIKNAENVIREHEKDMQHATQEPRGFNLETAEKGAGSRIEGLRTVYKVEAHSGGRRAAAAEASTTESQRKNSDGKTVGTFGKKFEERHKAKLSSSTKEDSWTLFKPPPVFPVDNSSARIVPKISYASKVKENLNKSAPGGGEALPPPIRLSQVPMSAMKTITSTSFTNGPVSGNGNGCPSVGTFFAPAASSILPAPSLPSGENVAPPLDSNCSSTTSPIDADPYELRKCTLLIYPLNMQPVLPSARQLDPPAAQTNQKALGDIFQNQWGLSFINEPNLGPEGGNGQPAAEDKTAVVTFQGECPDVAVQAAQPCLDASPPITEFQGPEKRTCAPCGVSSTCPPASVAEEEGTKVLPCGQEKANVEAKGPASSLLAPSKDNGAKPVQGLLATLAFGSSKDPAHSKGLDRRCSWGSFDVKAAVNYHTKEMEYIFSLQKQDPKRVVVYDETKDVPDQ